MRVSTLNFDANPPERSDMEVSLRRLASSPDRLVAAKWQKLLELVHALRADGPNPDALGLIVLDEFWLSPANPANRVLVGVRVDWRDFAPLVDGLPEMHYRMQIQRRGCKLSKDARARTPEEAGRIIRDAFGWSR